MLLTTGTSICENCFEDLPAGSAACGACGYVGGSLPENMGTLPIGTALQGKYVIGKMLGKGGFGVTYLAYDTTRQCKVAVKEYYPDSLSYRVPGSTTIASYSGEKQTNFTAGSEKFYDEARTLSRFNGNDHIVNVQDFFRENNTAYYVMEYVDGIDIKKYAALKGGRLPFNEVLDIIVPIIYALIIVHSMDVLHRDISPDNIYLTRDGGIKLLDFGAARQVYGDQSSNLSVILKHGYTPIEQYRRQGHHGPWSDIYALGATMYFLLTGTPPEESVNRVENDGLLMPSQLGIPIPAELEIVMRKMLAVKAEDRYQSVIELKEALKAAGAPGGGFSASTRESSAKKGLSRKKLIGIAAGSTAVLITLLFVLAFSARSVKNRDYVFETSVFSVECTYTGKWSSGAPNGKGVLTINDEVPSYWEEGAKLEGKFVDGLMQGEGVQKDLDGSVYTGGFKNGLRSGQGKYVYSDGSYSEGEYQYHYLNGSGKYVGADGEEYEGDYKNGYRNGYGVYTGSDGRRYEGDFVMDNAEGYGVFTDTDGSRYEGSYVGDYPNGEGVHTTSNGWVFTGNFIDGVWDGEGVLTDADDNEMARGTWVNGEFQGENWERFSQDAVENGD